MVRYHATFMVTFTSFYLTDPFLCLLQTLLHKNTISCGSLPIFIPGISIHLYFFHQIQISRNFLMSQEIYHYQHLSTNCKSYSYLPHFTQIQVICSSAQPLLSNKKYRNDDSHHIPQLLHLLPPPKTFIFFVHDIDEWLLQILIEYTVARR